MTTLITGGLGYIGQQLALSMDEPCILVDHRAYGSLSSAATAMSKQGHSVMGQDISALTPFNLQTMKVDKIVHLAAQISVQEGESNPGFYYQENVYKTAILFSNAAVAKVRNFVFASSAAVYPADAKVCTVKTQPSPANWYGRTKYAAEGILTSGFHPALDMHVAMLRFFNVIGADPEGRAGKVHGQDVLSVLLDCAMFNTPFTLYGAHWESKDGTAVRDFVSVHDVVAQIKQDLGILDSGLVLRNVASGNGTSLGWLRASVEEVVGHRIPVKVQPPRPGEVGVSRCRLTEQDNTPTHDIMDDIRDAWAWRKSQA